MAHSLSGGAIGIALDRMEAEGLTYGFQFRFFVNYTECSGSEAAGVAVDFMKNRNMDVVIAPPCPEAAKIMAHLSTFYKKTLLGWGFLSDSEFSDSERFPYLTKALPDSLSMMKSVLQLFQMYDWNRVAIFYTPNEVQYCDSIIDDAMVAFADESTYMVEVVQKSVWNRQDDDNFRNQMLRAKRAARSIIVMCLDTAKDRRTFMKTALRLDMVSDEFVYVLLGMRGFAFVSLFLGQAVRGNAEMANGLTPYWEDLENNHADDQIVKEASLKLLVVDVNGDDVDRETLKNFTEKVVPRVREDPLYCSTNACLTNDGKPMATWARYLHDVFYLYGLSLNDSLTLDPVGGQSNASTLSHSMRRSFVGLTGAVTINENGSRVPLFSVYGLDSNYNQVTFVNFTLANGVPVMSKGYTDEATSIWATRQAFWDKYSVYVITGAAILALFLLATILFFVYIIRIRQMEQEQLRLQWQVPYIKLRKPPSKKELQHLSKPSLQSGPSTITGDSRFNSEANFGNYTVYFIDKDAVLTTKHPISAITQEDYVRFPKDLISKGSLWFDPFFMFCIMRDIAE
ncbi:ligand-binding protein, receptor family, partial [Necator americanus]